MCVCVFKRQKKDVKIWIWVDWIDSVETEVENTEEKQRYNKKKKGHGEDMNVWN